MASRSQQMRNMYPELIIGAVDENWNVLGYTRADGKFVMRPKCSWSTTKRVKFLAGGNYAAGFVWLKFHPEVIEWAMACAAVFLHHGYSFDESAGGSCSCRKITGGSKTSLHAHGCVFDINPSRNRYRKYFGLIQWGLQTDMSKEMIRDLEAIRTVNGKAVTQWGGRWTNIKDAMHFEPSKCDRVELHAGIDFSTVVGWTEYVAWLNDPGTIPPELPDQLERELEMQLPLRKGDGYENPPSWSQFTTDRSHKFDDVKSLQERLGMVEAEWDGLYGGDTAARVAFVLANGSDGTYVGGPEWNRITKLWLAGGVDLDALDARYAAKTHPHEATTEATTTIS